jgi:hypothetical protein
VALSVSGIAYLRPSERYRIDGVDEVAGGDGYTSVRAAMVKAPRRFASVLASRCSRSDPSQHPERGDPGLATGI